MDAVKETKTGTLEELQKDLDACGFYPEPEPERTLDSIMSATRIKLDNAIQSILMESGLPLYLFDLLITSVQNDIRKADLDMIRAGAIMLDAQEHDHEQKAGE